MKIKLAQIKEWLDQVSSGKISFSRMVEMINQESSETQYFLFTNEENYVSIISKGPNAFMACCYANNFLKSRKYNFEFSTDDAFPISSDLDLGVIYYDYGNGRYQEFFTKDHKPY